MDAIDIFLIVLGIAIVVPWILEIVYVLSLRASARKSESFLCRSLRYIVYITGKVRSGKTTFQAGYANIRTKWLRRKAVMKIRFTCLAFPDVPFDAIDGRLADAMSQGEIDSWAMARKLISKGQILSAYSHLAYDNHLSAKPVPFLSILADYIDAKWALMRDNYVYYYGKAFHSWVTGNDAMDYSPAMLAIKDAYINPDRNDDRSMDYHILPYSIICEDEKQLSGKDCTQFFAYAKADSGSADFLRLIGQMGQETIFYTTTNQYWGTDINRERQLATEVVSMEKSVALNPRFCEMAIVKLIEIPARIVLWFRRHASNDVDPYLVNSKSRTILGWTMDLRKRISSHSYVFFKGIIYHDANDFGKPIKSVSSSVDRLRCVIPIRYCRGSTNTFEFHTVQRMLISKSRWRLTDEPGEVRDDDLASRVLQKRIAGKAVPSTDDEKADRRQRTRKKENRTSA